MNIHALRNELDMLGVELWEENGLLRYRAPAGALDEALLQRLRQARDELLRALAAEREQALQGDPAEQGEPFPLTDVQAAYLLGRSTAFAHGGVACHGYLEFAFPGLEVARLERAWNQLIERHPMLRAVVSAEGHQRILAEVPCYRLAEHRLDAEGRRLAELRERMELRRAGPDCWPLVELCVSHGAAGDFLHLSVDLLVCDYQSVRMLLGELHQLYHGGTLAEPARISFRDYVLAERRLREGPRYGRDRDYWLARIDGLPGAPELPLADAQPGARFRRLALQVDERDYRALGLNAAGAGIGVSAAVLAAYAETLGRWSRRGDFCLSLTLLNRLALHPQVERLVGDFSSVEVLQVDTRQAGSFAERAAQLQARLWEDMDHRLFSGIEVLRELARRRGRDAALLPYAFTSTLGAGGEAGRGPFMPGAELVHGISQTPQVLIDCQVSERDGGLWLNWDYREGAFAEPVLRAMFDAFCALLLRLAREPSAWALDDCLELPATQRLARELANQTDAPLPEGLLHEPVFARARLAPRHPALVQGGRSLDFAELAARAEAVAAALLDAGCQRGERVAVCMDKGIEQIIAVLGILRAGAAYLPLDTSQPEARRELILENAGVWRVATHSALEGRLAWPARIVQALAVDRLQPYAGAPLPASPAQPGELAYVIYTSGSTGVPKGVMISHQAALNTLADINERFQVDADDRILGLASLGFDLSVYDIFGALAAGATLVLPDAQRRGDPSHWAACAREQGVTLWNSVPAQLQMLLHYLRSEPGAAPQRLRLALLSGDWIPLNLAAESAASLPHLRLVGLGGATEAAIWSIIQPLDEVPPHWRSVPYGRPLANQRFHVLDERLRDRPDGVAGELYIAGEGLALGYLGDAQKTAERFIRHPVSGERLYRTGDLGRYLADGSIEFLGREDFQVKVRGHRIELAEVESALLDYPGVQSAVVVAQGEEALERRLVAFLCAAPATTPAAWPGDLAGQARAAGQGVGAGLDPGHIREMSEQVERAALLAMAAALKRPGLFDDDGRGHSLDDICQACEVAPRNRRLIRRWLRALAEEGLLAFDEARGGYCRLQVREDALRQAWARIDELEPKVGWGAEVLRYLRESQERLPELMSDRLDPLHLLFPEGRTEVADGAYRRNLISQYLNRAVCAALRRIAADFDAERPLRLLEIGAGVGGTSCDLIPALAGLPVDYQFTDLSQYFLNEARERFADYPWVRYGLFDLNQEPWRQGIADNSLDVILCANVLHNARDAGRVLARLRRMLAPGGWLVFIEATRDTYQIMASMEFKEGLTEFEDLRRELDTTFLRREQWQALLAEAGAEAPLCLPEAGEAMSCIGQHLFIARFKADRQRLEPAALREHLALRLPQYMLPAELLVLDELPLTANGKVDRQALASLRTRGAEQSAASGEPPRDELERAIAEVWQETLRVPAVGREQGFFELGGDSLLVAQVVGRLRERLPALRSVQWDQLLRQLINQPTVAALADFVRARDELRPGSPLVSIREQAAGHKRIFVHDGSGTLAPYRALFGALEGGADGLVLADVAGYLALEPEQAIRRLAESYADTLQAAGLRSLSIVGYCLGGLLASELASCLKARGVAVEALTVISSYRVPFLIEDDLLAEYVFARVMQADPRALGYPLDEAGLEQAIAEALQRTPGRVTRGVWQELEERPQTRDALAAMRRLAARSPGQRLQAIALAMRHAGSQLSDLDWLGEQLRVLRHSLAAVALHQATPYDGDMLFVRQTGEVQVLPGMHRDMSAYWRELCLGRLQVVDVPGDHFSCMQAPHVQAVARACGQRQETPA
ncbi:non-ribosomal peptide synthetase [Pseudomonas citronellolis]|uniref:non-ribosomal peptide synthetase n=1 Tax=Pseudomonas citronellolis TaxID=53408 RepID=UPI0021BE2D06|nr:non-ribosomal peptide synthetase [Pseudomonas citronellolis]